MAGSRFFCALLGFSIAALVQAVAPVSAAETPLERGTYLMRGIVACGNCHTPKGPDGIALPDRELAGGLVIDTPVFRAVVPNITPDNETGIGKWTGDQLVAAIREGKRPDGSIIGPPMPIEMYRAMSDSDARAIVAYLRAIEPIRNATEKSTYRIPLPASYGPPVGHVADVPPANKLAYGKYLSDIGHCMDCHSPLVRGQLDLTRAGMGGRELGAFPSGVTVTANLTSANPDGIAKWTDAQVKQSLVTGIRPDGRHLVRLMAFDWYKTIASKDLDALVAYLRTLKPARQ